MSLDGKMSENVVSSSEMDGERELKLTAKAFANKIEKLQEERKMTVNKMKGLIPQMKTFMNTKENVSHVQSLLENLNQRCEHATSSHNVLIPLLPEDEEKKLTLF